MRTHNKLCKLNNTVVSLTQWPAAFVFTGDLNSDILSLMLVTPLNQSNRNNLGFANMAVMGKQSKKKQMRLDCLRNTDEEMYIWKKRKKKNHLTEVILRTGGTAVGYFRVYQWLACQLMELSTLSAWLPDLTLKQELQKGELNSWSVTNGVEGL